MADAKDTQPEGIEEPKHSPRRATSVKMLWGQARKSLPALRRGSKTLEGGPSGEFGPKMALEHIEKDGGSNKSSEDNPKLAAKFYAVPAQAAADSRPATPTSGRIKPADKYSAMVGKGIEKGKGLARRLTLSPKPKQKDPLHQWMVDHSGGTIRDK
ncbi:hypothetical protein GGS23DRAFT_547318 [Durotheca rogersii]|uniref:uncharacterized protein n=1 Tax=Durotheca rogersii TaxID=419775 RepID=UPI002220D0A8|nr:uncharacterized protein GGS23DRAFT_547318 [Durotheca rogersii]KAI5867203.1 hypothetical protein GGS23DRAFT_547318 [Durotheca rogersii]